MIGSVLAVAAVVAVVIAAFVLVDRNDARQRDERRELMNRVQRPELVVGAAAAPRVSQMEPEPDELHLVGAILPVPDAESS